MVRVMEGGSAVSHESTHVDDVVCARNTHPCEGLAGQGAWCAGTAHDDRAQLDACEPGVWFLCVSVSLALLLCASA